MDLKTTRLHILHEPKDIGKEASTGVSLHCHTQHSREMLDFVPHYAEKLPIIAQFWRKEQKKQIEREGKGFDFSTAYWSPPMTENDVYTIEKNQINNAGLEALVSITDHDNIDANLYINQHLEKSPISLEWTVPFEYGFFHLGIHNLPESRAIDITKDLLDFTFAEERKLKFAENRLHDLFSMLNGIPEILIVLNHPIWDIEMVGQERHEILLGNFIKEYGRWIHAFEINGFRSWSENKSVIEMAEALGFPLVTGGDRHGCKPNTVINLTNSGTFSEFVEEIRVDKKSEVVLMPEYKQPLHSRQLNSFAEILRFYPDHPEGRKKWFDRVYFDIGDGFGVRKLSVHWRRGGPTWLRWAIWTLGVLGHERMRPAFRVFMKGKDVVPKDASSTKFVIPDVKDITPKLSSEAAAGKTGFAS